MRLSAKGVYGWLCREGSSQTLEELLHIQAALTKALESARQRHNKAEKALAELDQVAQAQGFKDLADLLSNASPEVAAQFPTIAHVSKPVGGRKPFLDPMNPESDCYALGHRKQLPAWVEDRLAEGWTREELHYKRHAAGYTRLGIKPVYDAAARYKELNQASPTFRRRNA